MHLLLALAAIIYLIIGATAQDPLEQKIWSTVIFTLHGESTPYAYLEDQVLTPLGAHQLFRAGSTFRNRYVDPTRSMSYVIDGISRQRPNPDQIGVVSLPDQFISASAQAFMQGLYPPRGSTSANTSYVDEAAHMADGTIMNFPLSGYNYPEIYTPSRKDPNHIWISGNINCLMYTSSMEDYLLTEEYQRIQSESSSFYNRLYAYVLDGLFSRYSSVYSNALSISEYLSYRYNHVSIQGDRPALSDVRRARALADRLASATNSNRGRNGDPIGAVAGRTLARSVLSGLERNILADGDYSKMTLLFGTYEPMIAFYSLVQLVSRNRPDFSRISEFGSSIIFELYSLEADASSASYPSNTNDLMVRFLVRNGTDYSNPPIPYPLFGHGPGVIGVPYSEFEAEMKSIMVSSTREWCTICNSSSVFCPFYENRNRSSPSGVYSKSRLVAVGIISTVATIIFIGLVLFLFIQIASCMDGGGKRRTETGERDRRKLQSDPNLAVSGFSGVSVNRDGSMSVGTTEAWGSAASVDGPEGTGDSWEMMPQSEHSGYQLRTGGRGMGSVGGMSNDESQEDDDELQLLPHPKPVMVREHV